MAGLCHARLNGPSTASRYGTGDAQRGTAGMIDNLGLAISHGLILLAAWRLFIRPDLNDENAPEPGPQPERQSRFRWKGRPGA